MISEFGKRIQKIFQFYVIKKIANQKKYTIPANRACRFQSNVAWLPILFPAKYFPQSKLFQGHLV